MGLPKKYAKMGFKEGWKAFNRSKLNKKQGAKKTMAKKRRSSRSMFRKAKKTYKRASDKSLKVLGVDIMNDMVMPGIYGAVRVDFNNLVTPYTNKLPVINQLGDNADEVGLILAGALISKYVGNKVPMVRKIARAGIMIESAQLGQSLRLGTFGKSGSVGSAQNSFR